MLQVLISFKINFLSPKTSQRAHSLWEDNDEVAFGRTHETCHQSLSNKYKNKRKNLACEVMYLVPLTPLHRWLITVCNGCECQNIYIYNI